MDKKAMINIKQHKRKIQLTSIGLILLLVLALTFTIIGTKYTPTIELTQLQNNSNSQMMGYFIKCDDKNIVVDGGTKEDSNNLQQYIKDAGGTVNAWFITHPHKDHAGSVRPAAPRRGPSHREVWISLLYKKDAGIQSH